MRLAILFLFLIPLSAAARSSPSTCFQACKVLNESKDYDCAVSHIDGVGGIMILDVLAEPSQKDLLMANQARDCFFDAGGSVLELHRANDSKTYISCGKTADQWTPYFCEKQAKSQSLRRVKR